MPPLSCTRHVLSRLCGSLLASQSVPIKTSSSLGCGRLCGDDRRYGGDISSRPCVRRDACCSGERHRPSGRWAEGTSSRPFAASASALAAVIVVGQLIGRLFAIVGQPPVIGEVLAGILLGSSLLGPRISAFVLPPEIAPYLQVISQLGVILYMFMVGLDLNAGLIKGRAHTLGTSHASILLPFLLGSVVALALYPRLSSRDVPFTSFVLFLAVGMSITAFPVLARILTDHGMSRTELEVIALSCAATDHVTAWCQLAFVVGIAKAQAGS